MKRDDNSEMWRSLALYGSLSLSLGLITLGGYYLGRILERFLHWDHASIFGVLIAFIIGLFEMFVLLLRMESK